MIKRILAKLLKKPYFLGQLGNNTELNQGIFNNSSNIILGDNVYVGPFSYWDGLGGIEIEENVIIGPRSTIWTYNHNYKSEDYLPYDGKEILKSVKIEKNVWMGINVSISPGVNIGEGAIIAMSSNVTKSVPPLAIVGGNPAQIIGYRDKDVYQKTSSKNCSYLKAKKAGLINKELIKE